MCSTKNQKSPYTDTCSILINLINTVLHTYKIRCNLTVWLNSAIFIMVFSYPIEELDTDTGHSLMRSPHSCGKLAFASSFFKHFYK